MPLPGMLLRHLHLSGLRSYASVSDVQDALVSRLLSHKADPTSLSRPGPVIITTEFQPVYTCGRREMGSVSPQQQEYLAQETPWGRAAFSQALRGGQTTFHGPGQMTAYPIIDLRRHGLSPRCYIHQLEHAVIETCAHYGVSTTRTENPGVWLPDGQRKICAVGVHLRRNVSSHGVGLNVSTELGWFERIVACGLEGKGTTNLVSQRALVPGGVQEVGHVFAHNLAQSLRGVEALVKIEETDVR